MHVKNSKPKSKLVNPILAAELIWYGAFTYTPLLHIINLTFNLNIPLLSKALIGTSLHI